MIYAIVSVIEFELGVSSLLDHKTLIAVQIAAATAANAMPALRQAVADGLAHHLTKEEIRLIIDTAQDIQQQPAQHTFHLAAQLLREPPKPVVHNHGDNCSCGCHS